MLLIDHGADGASTQDALSLPSLEPHRYTFDGPDSPAGALDTPPATGEEGAGDAAAPPVVADAAGEGWSPDVVAAGFTAAELAELDGTWHSMRVRAGGWGGG